VYIRGLLFMERWSICVLKRNCGRKGDISACKVQLLNNFPNFLIILVFFLFLDALEKLRTISLFLSICLSVCLSLLSFAMEQLGSIWTDFYKILRLLIIGKPIETIQIWLKSDRVRGISHERLRISTIIFPWIIRKMKSVSDRVL
jgi:hypothetical protein